MGRIAMGASDYLDSDIETASADQLQYLQKTKLAQLDYLFAHSVFYREKLVPLIRKACKTGARLETAR